MSKRVFIGVGHGGVDTGAVKYLVEKDINLVMALSCGAYLQAHGVEVRYSRTKDENDDINEEIRECNAFRPDVAIDVHNNAGGGDGFEAYYTVGGGVGKTLALNIENQVKQMGQNSRGIKSKANSRGTDYYAFVRQTSCPAVIVEGLFVDNATDVAIGDTVAKQQAFGVAYAKGILQTLGIADSTNVTSTTSNKTPVTKITASNKPTKKVGTVVTSDKLYRVQVGSFRKKTNADALVRELQAKGYKPIVKYY